MLNLIEKAAKFAEIAHEGQKRKWSGLPYIVHPFGVARKLQKLGYDDEEMIAAAYLHDVLEDTPVSLKELDKEFGPEVGRIVVWLTNASKDVEAPRAQRKTMDRQKLMYAPIEAKTIKLADRLDNVKSLDGSVTSFIKLYLDETELLLDVIGDANKCICHEIRDAIAGWRNAIHETVK